MYSGQERPGPPRAASVAWKMFLKQGLPVDQVGNPRAINKVGGDEQISQNLKS